MAFSLKNWLNRQSEFPNRRRLTEVEEGVFDVDRAEGVIAVEGDVFDAATMNDLEGRINSEFRTHQHTGSDGSAQVAYGNITGKPASLPANGGRADTANKLTTARRINGVAFDGSADITVTANPNAHNQSASTISAGTFQGAVVAQSNADYGNRQVRNAIISPNNPSGGLPGDIWFQYS